MNYEIYIAKDAKNDLSQIYDYIYYELQSPQTAYDQVFRIREKIKKLDVMPERHQRVLIEPWYNKGLRFVTQDNYNIVYAINDSKGIVVIVGVIYGARDLSINVLDGRVYHYIDNSIIIDFPLSKTMQDLVEKAEEADLLEDYSLYMNIADAIDSQGKKETTHHIIRESDWNKLTRRYRTY